jgi:hypothetical protein
MRRRQPTFVSGFVPAVGMIVTLAIAGCGASTPTPAPTAAPTVAPTLAPTAATGSEPPASQPAASINTDPFAGEPFTMTLPAGWQGFNLQDPAAQTAIDAFAASNPNLAASIQAFKAMPGVRMAVNPLLGNIVLVLTTPSNGMGLDVISQAFNVQFSTVQGLQAAPSPEAVTVPGGNATHWDLNLTANKAGGGTVTVSESIYLLVSSTTGVILEFVVPSGGPIPNEQAILNSFMFTTP